MRRSSAMAMPLLYWRTLRHLKPIQIYARLWRLVYHPSVSRAAGDPARHPATRWLAVPRPARQAAPDRFQFIGQERRITSASDWNRGDWPKLWLYNLHYFEDLVADGAEARADSHRDLIARWIAENPVGHGVGWEAYPTSLRLVNWTKWLLGGREAVPGMHHSMILQTRSLSRRLEYHLLGNHLWANFKALIFSGCLFDGAEGRRWLSRGLAGMRGQLDEQILPDGGHFERSPMYHALLLEDMLDLLQLARCVPGVIPASDEARWRSVARCMDSWLRLMCHPDGQIAFFNDAALGIAADPAALHEYAARLDAAKPSARIAPSSHLAPSGYLRLVQGRAVVLADAAPVGPDYLPGHAHADTLSFELSLDGERVLVNGGTSTYEAGPQRQRERATASHNTVEVDGRDSSEVWGAFRVGRRAMPRDVQFHSDGSVTTAAAAHDGYRCLPGRVLHRRAWRLDEVSLSVEDELAGAVESAIARYRLAPGWHVVVDAPHAGRLISDCGCIRFECPRGHAFVESSSWRPEFGVEVPTHTLAIRCEANGAAVVFRWDARAA